MVVSLIAQVVVVSLVEQVMVVSLVTQVMVLLLAAHGMDMMVVELPVKWWLKHVYYYFSKLFIQ